MPRRRRAPPAPLNDEQWCAHIATVTDAVLLFFDEQQVTRHDGAAILGLILGQVFEEAIETQDTHLEATIRGYLAQLLMVNRGETGKPH